MPDPAPTLLTWGATITNIVDGDTFDVVWDNGYVPPSGLLDRIRIAGVDTNEKYPIEESFAQAASDRLAELIPVGTHVTLQAIDETSNSYGRPVRHVFVNDVNVANVLLEEGLGLAVSYEYEPSFRAEYFASAESAMEAGVGMWAEGASGGDPSTWSELEFFVNYDAGGDDHLNLNDEFIHIQNNGPYQMDLTGWTFRKSGKPTTTDIPDGTILEVGETFRIYTGTGTDTAHEMYLGMADPFFDNVDDVIYLRDEHLNVRGYQAWPGSAYTGPESSIVIDDVQYNAPGADDATNPNGEWIIIRNAGDETVDLTNWRLKDNSADYVFNDGETLDAGQILKIFIGSGTDSGDVRYWGNATGILNNDDGKLEIWTPKSQAVDAYVWGSGETLNENARGAIRMFANYDGQGNDTTNPNGEWVALENTSDSDIDLSGFSVKTAGHTYTFADGTMLAADTNIRVMVGSGTDTASEFYWGKAGGILSNGGDYVNLSNADDEVLLRHEWPNSSSQITDYGLVIEKVNFDAPGSDTDNPNGEWLTIRNASSHEQNLLNWKIVVGPEQLVILQDQSLQSGEVVTIYVGSGTNTADEIYWGNPSGILYNSGSRAVELYNPNRDVVETHSWGSATSPAQSVSAAIDITINYDAAGIDADNMNGEWVNLSNLSSSTISLDGYHLYTDGTTYTFDSGDTLDAGDRIRVYLGSGTDGDLDRYADGSLNGFNNTQDGVELRRNDTGGTVDSFDYPFTGQPLTTGEFKITAVNPDAPGVDDDNPNGEWIDITNTGSGSADLRDWRIQYQTGTFFDFNDSTVVAAGDTVRIHMGQGTDTASEFYWGNANAALSNTAGNLSLQSNYRVEVDTYTWDENGSSSDGPESSIVIDDVQYNAPGADDATNPNGEWIIIRNAGDETVDLTNWRIKDNSADYVFNNGETLDAGETLKIFIGSGTDSGTVRYWGNATGILNNSDGKLEIWTPQSQAVDAYAWGDTENLNENARGAIRMFANFDGEGSDTTNPNGEWVALENTSDSAIDLSGYSVKTAGHAYTFADGTMLAADANIRLMVGSGTDTASEFYWGKASGILSNGGDYVDLSNAADDVLLRHEWPNPSSEITDYGFVIEAVNFDALGSDTDNPNGEWLTIRNASSAEQNLINWKIVIGPEQLVILEDHKLQSGESVTIYMGSGTNTADSIYWGEASGIMYNSGSRAIELYNPNRDVVETHSWGSATSPAQSVAAAVELTINYDAAGIDADNMNGEWVNLTNTSSSTISLDDFHLYTDGTSYHFDASDTLDAGDRIRVYLGTGTDNGFDRYADGNLNGFNNTADEVELRRNDTGGTVDSFTYPYNGPPVARGNFKITAVNPDAPGVDDDNPNGEWIDITNTGSTSADLRDWRIQYQTGTFFDFNDSAVVAAGDTVRIHMGQGTNTASEFYWGNANAALSNSSGNLSLQSNYRIEVDTYTWRTSLTNADTITGTDSSNTIKTYGGNDTVYGGAGDDMLYGGEGDDLLKGDDGNDTIYGESGQDTLYGGNNDDNLYGGGDDDNLYGGGGDDYIKGHSGNDYLKGHSGEDYLRGGDGTDTLKGGSGDDLLKGEDGNDTIYGEDGDDTFYGGNGDDKLYGGGDDDKLYGGGGDDYIKGHSGNDYLKGHSGVDYLRGGDGNDVLKGGSGNDKLKGENDDDTIYGETGNDRLYGGNGVDTMYGDEDDDYFDGGNGDDILYGGSGADTFHFDHGEDNDVIKDFENNVDTIELDNFGYADATEALTYATEVGGDVVFDFGGGDTLIVENATKAQLINDIYIV